MFFTFSARIFVKYLHILRSGELVIGGIGGALLAANNYKMRTLIKKGQEEVQMKLDKLMDEKIKAMEEATETLKEKAEETVEKVKDKVTEATEKAKA